MNVSKYHAMQLAHQLTNHITPEAKQYEAIFRQASDTIRELVKSMDEMTKGTLASTPIPERVYFVDPNTSPMLVYGESEINEANPGYSRSSPGASTVKEAIQEAIKHVEFTTSFWLEKVEIKDEEYVARIDGEHYIIGNENEPSLFRGCAGRRFVIRFNDGREIVTTNLWCQGTIPHSFRKVLPDNATWSK